MKKIILTVVGLIILSIAINWGFKTFQKPGHMGILESQTMDMSVQPPTGVMPVRVEKVKYAPFASGVSYVANAVAYNEVPVYPRIQGWLISLGIYPGNKVKNGQVIAQLDSSEISSKVGEANFAALAAKQNYKASLNTVNENNALLEKSQQAINATKEDLNYWKNEINRSKTLVDAGVISIEEFQSDQAKYAQSLASHNQAQEEYRALKNALMASKNMSGSQFYQSKQALQNLETQKIIKKYTTITAPFDGLVTERNIPPGTLVSPGMQIVKIVQINPLRIQANVSQSDINKIKVGDDVIITDSDNLNIKSKISSVFPSLETKTRTGIVEALIKNDNWGLLPGDFIKMNILTGKKKEAITVPNSAIIKFNQQDAVWTIANNKASLNYVTTGNTNGTRMEIVSGLNNNDIVIISGISDLKPDMPVKIVSSDHLNVAKITSNITHRLSKENNYSLKLNMSHYELTIITAKNPPVIGDNPFKLNISSMHVNIPSNLDVEARAFMPAMPKMIVPKPQIQKLSDGKFKGNLTLTMPGLWQIDVAVKQGNEIIIKNSFEIEVPE